MKQKPLYFDANATTPIHPDVLAAMRPFLEEEFGNPSSAHLWGRRAKDAVEEARSRCAVFLGCEAREIIFTSSGTESNNLAVLGALGSEAARRNPSPGSLGVHCVTTMIEHGSVLDSLRWLESWGVQVTRLAPGSSGAVSVGDFFAALRPDTVFASVMLVNNETGVIQPVREMAEEARARNIVFHVDAVQGAGKIRFTAPDLGADLVTLAGHKAEGPKGGALLYARRGTRLSPIIHGGSQDGKLRGGTHNVPAIVGCGAAFARADRSAEASRSRTPLRDAFEEAVLKAVPGAVVNGAGAPRVWNTANITFPGISGEALLERLDREGVAASRGAACSAGLEKPSHVLSAMGLSRERAISSIRFSFLSSVTEEEIFRGAAAVAACVMGLRRG